jgi:hypothetical protein
MVLRRSYACIVELATVIAVGESRLLDRITIQHHLTHMVALCSYTCLEVSPPAGFLIELGVLRSTVIACRVCLVYGKW